MVERALSGATSADVLEERSRRRPLTSETHCSSDDR